MKIAIVTNDGQTLNPHFGRATHYLVVDTDNNERQLVAKGGHHNHVHDHTHDHDHHGHGADHHNNMLTPIQDCQTVIAGGIGIPMQQAIVQNGFDLILTREKAIDTILQKYEAGTLEHNPRLAHQPGHH